MGDDFRFVLNYPSSSRASHRAGGFRDLNIIRSDQNVQTRDERLGRAVKRFTVILSRKAIYSTNVGIKIYYKGTMASSLKLICQVYSHTCNRSESGPGCLQVGGRGFADAAACTIGATRLVFDPRVMGTEIDTVGEVQ